MLILLKKFRWYLIAVTPLALSFLVLSLIRTNYDLIVPAQVSNLESVYSFSYDGDDYTKSDADIYSVSVFEYYKISLLTYFINKLYPYSVISEHFDLENTSYTYTLSSGTIQKNVSLSNALIAGYNAAKSSSSDPINIDYNFNGYIIHSIYGSSSNYFEIGDIITSVEGTSVTTDLTPGNILINDERTLEKDGEYQFIVLRNGIEKELTVKPFIYENNGNSYISIGISYYANYTIDNDTISPLYKLDYPDSIGPSAGLMQSLFVYDSLTNIDLSNLKICGTGTINVDGTVGTIGGIEAKICCAVKAGMDVFFVPEGNYDAAYERYIKFDTDMKLIKVSSLDDVISYLLSLKD